MNDKKFKINVVQFSPVIGEIEKNIEKHLEYIDKAIASGASLIVFPELSLTGYTLMDRASEIAVSPDDSIFQELFIKSAFLSIAVGFVEMSDDYCVYNSSMFIENGSAINVTRKIYPPTYGAFDEKRFFAQGNRIQSFNSDLGRFGTVICNDARHPALIYTHAMDGCKFLIIQSAVPARGFPQEDKPLPTKYFEIGNIHYSSVYGMYVIYANLAGYEDGLLFSGNSMITAPGGKIIAQAPIFEEAMISAEVSEKEIKKFRTVVPILGEENLDLVIDELSRIKQQKKL